MWGNVKKVSSLSTFAPHSKASMFHQIKLAPQKRHKLEPKTTEAKRMITTLKDETADDSENSISSAKSSQIFFRLPGYDVYIETLHRELTNKIFGDFYHEQTY